MTSGWLAPAFLVAFWTAAFLWPWPVLVAVLVVLSIVPHITERAT